MTRRLLAAAVVLAGALAPAHLAAQSLPNVGAPKRAAAKAVAATNRYTATMTAAVDPAPRDTRAAQPADSAPPAAGSRLATARAVPAAATTSASSAADSAVARRESFYYAASGRRDPFYSLMQTGGELRPLITDLRLVAVVVDPSGRNSVAILRDLGTKDQYRVKVGQTLGRMRVARIAEKTVAFTIEEFGYSRQQELTLGDQSQARTK